MGVERGKHAWYIKTLDWMICLGRGWERERDRKRERKREIEREREEYDGRGGNVCLSVTTVTINELIGFLFLGRCMCSSVSHGL